MSLNKDLILADLRYIIAEDPVSITHKGDTFNAIKSALNNEKVYTEMGVQYELEFDVVAPIEDFGTTPQSGDDITVAGTDYKIGLVDTDNVDVAYRLFIVNKTGVIG